MALHNSGRPRAVLEREWPFYWPESFAMGGELRNPHKSLVSSRFVKLTPLPSTPKLICKQQLHFNRSLSPPPDLPANSPVCILCMCVYSCAQVCTQLWCHAIMQRINSSFFLCHFCVVCIHFERSFFVFKTIFIYIEKNILY